MKIQEVSVGGKTRNVREERFEVDKEYWNEYSLQNGEHVRIKVVVHKIFRTLDEEGNPAFLPQGDPEVLVRHQIQISASAGPESNTSGEVQ